jgi:hypothetical protein
MSICRLVGIAAVGLLSGCANFTSIYRTLDIGDLNKNSPRAVAVDVKQRAVFATTQVLDPSNNKWMTRNIICPESSPDALSATSLGASISNILSATTGPGAPLTTDQLQAAVATGEAAASIGLRTQSIQLMRDGMVFNCLMFMNGALSYSQPYKLQRRNQNATLALLAIEQLTGPVKAEQVALTSNGQAGSGSENTDKQAASLESAQTKLTSANSEYGKGKLERDNAENERKLQEKTRDDANTAYQAAVKAEKANSNEQTKAEVAKTLATLNTEQQTLKEKTDTVQIKNIALNELDSKTKTAVQQVSIAQEALEQAKSRVRAATSSSAAVAALGGRGVLITDSLGKSVENIIKTVLDESGKGEMCEALVDTLIWTYSSAYTTGKKKVDNDWVEWVDPEVKNAQIASIVSTLQLFSCYSLTKKEQGDMSANSTP